MGTTSVLTGAVQVRFVKEETSKQGTSGYFPITTCVLDFPLYLYDLNIYVVNVHNATRTLGFTYAL